MYVTLDIFSDPICPWCMIGKARLDRAAAQFGRPLFRRQWRVFQLNPTLPAEGMDRKAYLEAKFGGPEGAARVYGSIAETAEEEGLGVDFSKIERTPNTADAHRVLKWAEPLGSQDAVSDALFDSYFRNGADISDRDVLLEAAAAGGLERDVVAKLLDGDAEREAVRAEDAAAREMGVTGAPTFVIAQQHVAPGAISTDTWLKVMEEIAAQLPADPQATG